MAAERRAGLKTRAEEGGGEERGTFAASPRIPGGAKELSGARGVPPRTKVRAGEARGRAAGARGRRSIRPEDRTRAVAKEGRDATSGEASAVARVRRDALDEPQEVVRTDARVPLRAELVVPHVVGAAEDVVTARQEAERERLALERRGRVGAGEASEVVKNKEVELGSVHRRPVVLRRDQRAGAGARHPRL